MSDSTIQLLRDLIAIDSVNPSLQAGAKGEGEIARAIGQLLQAGGLDVEIQEVSPGRMNVIGILDGKQKGKALMFCGHMDTVGVSGYTSPFDPEMKDGRIYGRGSQDMKGGLAAMIAAALKISRDGGLKTGRLMIAAVIDEEYGSIGADALVTKWKADAAVVGEPTDMKIAVGHKGFEWVEITTEGIAAHGSRPSDGRDAIVRMGRVLSRLEKLDRQLQSCPPHHLMGTGSLHASLINGGKEMSTYPDSCTLQLERRTVSGESAQCSLLECRTILDELHRDDPEFQGSARYVFGRPPYETPAGHALPDLIADALQQKGMHAEQCAMSFWTDAAILGQSGIPSVIFGPGGAGLHSISEYVLASDVITCRDALIQLANRFPQV